jgi:hypothetical protein
MSRCRKETIDRPTDRTYDWIVKKRKKEQVTIFIHPLIELGVFVSINKKRIFV